MEEEIKGLGDYLAILNRRKKQLILPVLIILVASIALAFGLPPVYRSEATILIEQQEIPPDLVRSTVTSYAGERIQIISQRVMTTENLGKIVEEYGLYKAERAERELQSTDQQIRTLKERKIYLQSELVQMSPTSDLCASDGKRVLSSEDRLQAAQAEYISLSARYSADHPDLIRMRREIAALERETGAVGDANELRRQLKDLKAEMVGLRERYSPEHPDVKKLQRSIDVAKASLAKAESARRKQKKRQVRKPDNPAYIQLQPQLMAAESELASISRTRSEIKAKITDFEQRLLESPQVEREYRALARDYENALARYKEVRAKQLEAELAASLERERKGERFSLIEPPALPEKPAKPNRLAILFLGFVFSAAGGVGTVAVAESLNKSIKDTQGLIAVTGLPPLVVVPYIDTTADLSRRRNLRLATLLVLLVLIGGTVTAFHFFFMPLDVFWCVIQRRLGIDIGS